MGDFGATFKCVADFIACGIGGCIKGGGGGGGKWFIFIFLSEKVLLVRILNVVLVNNEGSYDVEIMPLP